MVMDGANPLRLLTDFLAVPSTNLFSLIRIAMKTNSKQNIIWKSKNSTPLMPGWYYVHNLDGSIGSRYFDDSSGGSWWHSTARDGWTPNDSFVDWLLIPSIHLG